MHVAKIDGNAVTSDELVSWLKLTGRFGHVVQDMIKEKLTAEAAKRKGLDVSIEELQTAADNHRRLHGLQRVSEANEFLDEANVSLAGYEAFIEDTVLAAKLRDEVASDAAVEEYFNLHKPDYDAVDVGHIIVSQEDSAKEILATLQEDPGSFTELAKEESIAETAADGGRVGKVYRRGLPDELQALLFQGPECVAGPLATNDGCLEVFMVFERFDATLDDATRDMIKRHLYEAWLKSAANDYNVQA